jgi:nucleoid DNA-binding protein
MMLLKEDAIKDLSREVDAVFEKGKEEGWEWSDALSERLEGVFAEMCDRINRIKRVRLKKIVAFEVRKYERRRKGVPRSVGKSLVKRDQRLLGRRREADELVWFDC